MNILDIIIIEKQKRENLREERKQLHLPVPEYYEEKEEEEESEKNERGVIIIDISGEDI